MLRDLAVEQRQAAKAEDFMRQMFGAEIAVPRVNFEDGGKGQKPGPGDVNPQIRVAPGNRNCIEEWVASRRGAIQNDLQGRWDVSLSHRNYEYSFRLDGTVTWRDMANPGPIGAKATGRCARTACVFNGPPPGQRRHSCCHSTLS
jgi:hypothetical protein